MDAMSSSSAPKAKRKVLSTVLVLGLLALVVIIDVKRRAAEDQLAKLSMRLDQINGGNTEESRALAKEIVEKLGSLMMLPTGIEPTVATIVDVEKLRVQNKDFYANAQNGMQLVIYPTFAVIYDEKINKIINFAPVQITQPAPAANQPAPTPAQ